MSVLRGIRIVEFEGIGPGPFCGMLLADLGADVVTLCRPGAGESRQNITRRGKRVVETNLKSEQDRNHCLDLIAEAHGSIEGLRPGVMERLGLGPDICLERNPQLVFGRLTGWGQDGPLANTAGHDINYTALSGALWYSGRAGQPPVAAPTLVGDIAGGALYLAIGMLGAIMKARETGKGDVVDAAIVDGSAHMMNLLLTAQAAGIMNEPRGTSMLDGAHWYDSYECRDGKYISIGSLEPQFYRVLLEALELADNETFKEQYNASLWPDQKKQLTALFMTRTQEDWCSRLENTDACFAPILSPAQASQHPHIKQRQIYTEVGGTLQAAPAPRFQYAPATHAPEPGTVVEFQDIKNSWAE